MNSDPRQTDRDDMLHAAEALRRTAAALRTSLGVLEAADDEALERSARRHLEEAAPLRRAIARHAGVLRQGRRQAACLPAPKREALREHVDAGRRSLAEAERAYARFAERVRRLREAIEQRLCGVERGGRALGRYREGAALAPRRSEDR